LKPATIEQSIAAFNAESLATEIKKPAISPEKLRAIIGGAAFGVSFAAQSLSNRDADTEGIDDYFARKLNELALDMQVYAFTGKLPHGFAG
jgi:hypothetical protein